MELENIRHRDRDRMRDREIGKKRDVAGTKRESNRTKQQRTRMPGVGAGR